MNKEENRIERDRRARWARWARWASWNLSWDEWELGKDRVALVV